MTRDDLQRFRGLGIDPGSISLYQQEDAAYFCTPIDAEYVGWLGYDGVHFILLPEDERVFCVDPWGEEGSYVLPVARDFREFLSFVLYCRDTAPLSQLYQMTEDRFRYTLAEETDAEGSAKVDADLAAIAKKFGLSPVDPFEKVRALQAAFDPSTLKFSDEYYDTLGIERE